MARDWSYNVLAGKFQAREPRHTNHFKRIAGRLNLKRAQEAFVETHTCFLEGFKPQGVCESLNQLPESGVCDSRRISGRAPIVEYDKRPAQDERESHHQDGAHDQSKAEYRPRIQCVFDVLIQSEQRSVHGQPKQAARAYSVEDSQRSLLC